MRMYKIFLAALVMLYFAAGAVTSLFAQARSAYPDIPRIDVHAHIAGDVTTITNYLEMRNILKKEHDVDLAMWIDLASGNNQIPDLNEVFQASEGRVLSCISDFSAHDGLDIPPAYLGEYLKKGYIGYKIWAGPYYRKLKPEEQGYRYIDDPAHTATFAAMEEVGMVAASIHIADPNGPWGERTEWLADPIEYWREINAWRHVLERHPNLLAVVAHGDWLVCQDAQLDYLRNMFSSFPRLHVDLAATFQYFYLVNHENLRSFIIEWQDRIVFGTDIGRLRNTEAAQEHAERYFRCFRILETDETVDRGFFGGKEMKGLALPREVLEKIYYKNTAEIYPRVKEQLAKLGYTVD